MLAGLFVWAGVLKAIDPLTTADTVRNYEIIDDPWAIWVAVCLPWLEILCGVAILFRVLYAGALFLIGTMLVGFMGAIASVWIRGINVECGCFGATERDASYPVILLQDFGMLLIVFGLAWWERRLGRKSQGIVSEP